MIVVVVSTTNCIRADRESTVPANVSQVLERHTDSLMKISGVVGTAEGSCAGRPCILVLVERLTPAVQAAIPSQLEGVSVEIRESGAIEAR
jgi:hypothetical protein